mmetsp:Transcript_29960/g.75006  ORF Transcript_29960/g.75006 Transcript_29960/m.75006 type:complete len:163 (+) Transcript_29960:101-589(+)
MAFTAFVGRCMFAFVFLASAVTKLQTLLDGGAASTLDMLGPRLDAAKAMLAAKTGIDLGLLPIRDAHMLAAATVLEGAGAVLFVLDIALGAKMLLLFVLVVTPIMHPFWTHAADPSSAVYSVDMIAFFKNVALAGALLFYCDMQAPVAALRRDRRGNGAKRD